MPCKKHFSLVLFVQVKFVNGKLWKLKTLSRKLYL